MMSSELINAFLVLPLLAGTLCRAQTTSPRLEDAIADVRGRLFRTAGTEPDRIEVEGKVFAQGLHRIQFMAWHGRDLWVCNAPDLTIVRDLDGDDHADEYVLMGRHLTGLWTLEWKADGKLYMNTQDLASMPVHDLGKAQLFHANEYSRSPVAPLPPMARSNLEGALLRCDADGRQLEIVSRSSQPRGPFLAVPGHAPSLSAEQSDGREEKRLLPYDRWSFDDLWQDLGSSKEAQNVAAQEELLKRGESIKVGLLEKLAAPQRSPHRIVWALWTLGRAGKEDAEIEAWFAAQPLKSKDTFTRVECLKIIGYRMKEFGFTKEVPPCVKECLKDPLPEVREAAEQVLAALKK